MRVLIVEDQPARRRGLSALLRGRCDIESVDLASLGSEALTKLRQGTYDVVLVGPGAAEAGVWALLKTLRGIPGHVPSVLFVPELGSPSSLEKQAPGRAPSPPAGQRIERTLDLVAHGALPPGSRDRVERPEPTPCPQIRIGFKSEGRILFVDPRDLRSVEAQGNYVCLRGEGRVHVLRETISAMVERLQGFGFVRIHRSVLVNAAFVEEIKPYPTGQYGLRLEGGREYLVTRTYKGNLKSLAALWIGTDFARNPRRRRRGLSSRARAALLEPRLSPSHEAGEAPEVPAASSGTPLLARTGR